MYGIEIMSMRRYFMPFFVLGTLLLSSCSKDEMPFEDEIPADTDSSLNAGKVKMEFKAGIDAVSRTVLTTGNAVEWEADDAISLFDPDSNNKFTTSTGGQSVTFTGSAKDNQDIYYALYPYDGKATISDNVITTTLPAEQTARTGSFAKMLNPSVAKSGSDKALNFKNVCAVVKFTPQYTGSNNIKKVMFRGNNGEALAGTLQIDVSSETPTATVQNEFAGTEVTLNGEFTSGSTYYFVTAPAVLSQGLTLVFYDINNYECKKVGQNSTTLTASKILNLGEVTPGDFAPSQGYEKIDGAYHIYNADGLIGWATQNDAKGSNVVLQADIDMAGKTWTPVGGGIADNGYSGDFDGNGKYIKNLKVNVTSGNAGFFGGLAEGAKVHDIKFTGAEITGSSSVGVIAGESLGIIDRCNVRDSKVTGNNAGGITGNNSVQVNNCNVQNVTINGSYLAGGISAYNYGKIEYCTVSGNTTQITATGSSSRAGGIVASNSEEDEVKTSGRVLKCAVYRTAISGNWSGGIAGENGFGSVAQCVVDECIVIHGSLSSSTYLGGVVGYNARGEVVASYCVNSTVGADNLTSEAIGGIVGYNMNSTSSPAYVYGCYSTHVSLLGGVSNNSKGAIAGYNNGHVTSCYAVLPDDVTGITLVGNNNAVDGIDHCVEVKGTNYTVLEEAGNLTVTDGTIWVAAEIWKITASGIPSINADYIGGVFTK